MSFAATPPRTPTKLNKSFTSGQNSPWVTTLANQPRTPTSSKKKPFNEDVVYLSRSDLEKELKAFVAIFTSRKAIKEVEAPSYYDYLKKMIQNLVIDFTQLDNFEEFVDVTRSPGHKRSENTNLPTEHVLRVRNFQLERDRLAYEEKLQNHGKHIADLEDQIGKLIGEYKNVLGQKASGEQEIQELKRHLAASEETRQSTVVIKDQVIQKNAGLKKDIEILTSKLFELESSLKQEAEKSFIEKESTRIIETVKQENQRLTEQLTQSRGAVQQLETEKVRLVKEIGGLIDNMRIEDEVHEISTEIQRPNENNLSVSMTRDLKEKDVLIHLHKQDGERLRQELQAHKKAFKDFETRKNEEIRALKQIYSEREAKVRDEQAKQGQDSGRNSGPQTPLFKSLIPGFTNVSRVGSQGNFSEGIIAETGPTTPMNEFEDRNKRGSLVAEEELLAASIETGEHGASYYSLTYYEALRKKIEEYRSLNVMLQKKVEGYYIQIEELNNALKLTNENLDSAQNRCVTLQKELQNKSNLETLVQSLLGLINKLETKIEALVEENVSLQRANQENVLIITRLKSQIEETNSLLPKDLYHPSFNGLEETLENSMTNNNYRHKESAALEIEFLKKEYDLEISKIAEAKQKEIDEERIRNRNVIERSAAQLDLLSSRIQSLVAVNEEQGRELEDIKTDFANYKIVVVSILQEAGKSIENVRNYDEEIQALLGSLLEGTAKKGIVEVAKLRDIYGMMRKDVADAEKLLEERRVMV